jgi:hypothetical protein
MHACSVACIGAAFCADACLPRSAPQVWDKSPWNFGYFDYFTELKPKYVVAGEYLPRYYDLVIFCSPEFSIHYTRWIKHCCAEGCAEGCAVM